MEKIIVGVLAHLYVRRVSVLKSVDDTSVIECDKIVIAMDNVSTKKDKSYSNKKAKKTSTKEANVTNTAFINCHSKKSKRLLTDSFYIFRTYFTLQFC